MNKKKILIFTGSRADFWLLNPLANELSRSHNVEWLVSGGHLAQDQGFTLSQVEENSSLPINKITIDTSVNNALSLANSISLATKKYSSFFSEKQYDLLIVLGDRYEAFAVSLAANISGLKIAHISGGEETIGANDNYFRNCITKLAMFHFTSTERYRKRVIQMGEHPSRVWNVGALGSYNSLSLKQYSKEDLYSHLGLPNTSNFILATYHPVTLSTKSLQELFGNFQKVLDVISKKEIYCIVTAANCDQGGAWINEKLKIMSETNEFIKFYYSLGSKWFLTAARYASVVIGNSSSSIVELPSITNKIIDIGDRQKGRDRSKYILHCDDCVDQIIEGITCLLNKEKIPDETLRESNPYYKENTPTLIRQIIDDLTLSGSLQKEFYDLE